MIKRRSVLLILLNSLFYSGCTTTHPFSTEHENAWFINATGTGHVQPYRHGTIT
jgi:hypothetical protein